MYVRCAASHDALSKRWRWSCGCLVAVAYYLGHDLYELAWNSADGSYFEFDQRFCAREQHVVDKEHLELCGDDPAFPGNAHKSQVVLSIQ